MNPEIPTSFIPKRPVTSEISSQKPRNHTIGLLSLLTIIIVVSTGVSFVGVYLYEKSLASQKAKLELSINSAKDGIGSEFVSDMKRLTARIGGVKTLLQNHIVVSPIFSALEATTLRSIQYKTFTYEFKLDPSNNKGQVVAVSIDGVAKSYSTIALQSDAFAQSSLIKNPVFSNLTVDDKNSTVGFRLAFDVDPADLSFQTFIDAKLSAAGRNPVVLPSSVTPPINQ